MLSFSEAWTTVRLYIHNLHELHEMQVAGLHSCHLLIMNSY